MFKTLRMGFLATLLMMVPGGSAWAHPHVWVEARAALNFEDEKLSSITLLWMFDEFFSAVLYEDFDRNTNGRFESEEIDAMRKGAFTGLGEVNFFTDLRIAGGQVAWQGVRDFAVELQDGGSIVAYTFTLDLPEPVDLAARPTTLSLYDPDYYVSVELEAGPSITFENLPGESCSYTLEEAEDNVIYYGSVYPIRAVFECKGL